MVSGQSQNESSIISVELLMVASAPPKVFALLFTNVAQPLIVMLELSANIAPPAAMSRYEAALPSTLLFIVAALFIMFIVPNICMSLCTEKIAPPTLAALLRKVLIPLKITCDELSTKMAPNWPQIPENTESVILITLELHARALRPSPDPFPMIETLPRETD